MKLLFDQNISFRIIKAVSEKFPDALHISDLNLTNMTDLQIWEYAKNNQYTIVSFDVDFRELAMLKGCPPKVIWLRIGNTSTVNLARLFNLSYKMIRTFIHDQNHDISVLEINTIAK